MLLRILLITALALICHSIRLTHADVSELNVASAQDLLLPFNDLLPPLLDDAAASESITASSTTTTTRPTRTVTKAAAINTITTAAVHITKPTKKSFYHQQMQHIKELQLVDDNIQVPHDYTEQKQHLQHLRDAPEPPKPSLALDLLPPFEDAAPKEPQTQSQTKQLQPAPKTANKYTTAIGSSKHIVAKPVVLSNIPAAAVKAVSYSNSQHVAKQVRAPAVQHVAKLVKVPAPLPVPVRPVQHAAAVRPQQQPQQYAHVSRPHSNSITPSIYNNSPLPASLIEQYTHYFQHTTARPPRGPLPTLTPFPRHFK